MSTFVKVDLSSQGRRHLQYVPHDLPPGVGMVDDEALEAYSTCNGLVGRH